MCCVSTAVRKDSVGKKKHTAHSCLEKENQVTNESHNKNNKNNNKNHRHSFVCIYAMFIALAAFDGSADDFGTLIVSSTLKIKQAASLAAVIALILTTAGSQTAV